MLRYLVGILVGALGGIGADLLEQHHLRMLVITLAVVVGLAAGVVAGWRAHPLGAGLRNGLGVGIIAGALLVGGAAHSGLLLSDAGNSSRLTQLIQLTQLTQLTWLTGWLTPWVTSWVTWLEHLRRLALVAALVSGPICLAMTVAVGGLTSGWTGYHHPSEHPRPATDATPLAPLPTPA